MSGALRGSPAAVAREGLLDAFAKLGVIEYATSVKVEGRRSVQYLVRIGDSLAPWRSMDGKEVFPWLLGIAEAAALLEDDRAGALYALLAPYGEGADPVPYKALNAALVAAGKAPATDAPADEAAAG